MWYVLQVKTGSELRICSQLQKLNFSALVPCELATLRKGGEWITEERILFTSYVFVNLTFNADNYYKVKDIPEVIKFLGNGKDAVPLTYLEADYIKLLSLKNKPLEPSRVEFLPDGSVNIISGILSDFHKGSIEFDKRKRKAIVTVNLRNVAETVTLSIDPINETQQANETE